MLHLFTDGGVIGPNPSVHGATWAWCAIRDNEDRITASDYGVYPVNDLYPTASNNLAEALALAKGLANMRVGEDIWVYSDSQITLGRAFLGHRWLNIDDGLRSQILNLVETLKPRGYTLLAGHPSQAQLAAGVKYKKKSGKTYPVSKWNVWCDDTCNKIGLEHLNKVHRNV